MTIRHRELLDRLTILLATEKAMCGIHHCECALGVSKSDPKEELLQVRETILALMRKLDALELH